MLLSKASYNQHDLITDDFEHTLQHILRKNEMFLFKFEYTKQQFPEILQSKGQTRPIS